MVGYTDATDSKTINFLRGSMYTTLTELIEKILLGEDSTMVFKREMPHRNSMADEIAAFANAKEV